jgi:hypothetical protein
MRGVPLKSARAAVDGWVAGPGEHKPFHVLSTAAFKVYHTDARMVREGLDSSFPAGWSRLNPSIC